MSIAIARPGTPTWRIAAALRPRKRDRGPVMATNKNRHFVPRAYLKPFNWSKATFIGIATYGRRSDGYDRCRTKAAVKSF